MVVYRMNFCALAFLIFLMARMGTGFRLVQFNAEWLFMEYYEPAKCPGSGCTWANETEASIHFNYIAKVVDTLNPDIMNICEVEGINELELLKSRMIDGGLYNSYLIRGTDNATGQNVGLLTKPEWSPNSPLLRTENRRAYPLANSNCGYSGANGTVGVSKHYLTEFVLYGRPVLMIGLHLLAYPEDPMRCAEREAQAQVIQDYISEHYIPNGGEVIVMGDFNDFDGSVLDLNSNIPISQVLDILKGGSGYKYTLRSSAEWVKKENRYTDWWDKNTDCVSSSDEFSVIDHVLMTPFLFDKIKNVEMYHGYGEFCGKYDSDHYPLVIDFV